MEPINKFLLWNTLIALLAITIALIATYGTTGMMFSILTNITAAAIILYMINHKTNQDQNIKK